MKKNRGFTLVELIVVLVILAILAAVLVPALLGYIDKAKEKEDINRAKACLDAAQGAFVEAYGKGVTNENENVLGVESKKVYGKFKDVDATSTKAAEMVKNCTDEDPYIFMVAVGSSKNGYSASDHDRYTVYYACYEKDPYSRPYYYYDGAWTTVNPTYKIGNKDNDTVIKKDNNKGTNLLKSKNIYIQYYVLCNKDNKSLSSTDTNDTTFWYYLKTTLYNKYK